MFIIKMWGKKSLHCFLGVYDKTMDNVRKSYVYAYGWIVQLVQFKRKSFIRKVFSQLPYFMNTNLIFF